KRRTRKRRGLETIYILLQPDCSNCVILLCSMKQILDEFSGLTHQFSTREVYLTSLSHTHTHTHTHIHFLLPSTREVYLTPLALSLSLSHTHTHAHAHTRHIHHPPWS